MLAVLLAAAVTAPQPWAFVSPCKAVFFFPAKADGYAWNLDTSPANRMEYAWLVDVRAGDLRHNWGVTKFKLGSGETSGSLGRLLGRAQVNAWIVRPDGGNADSSAVVQIKTVVGEGGFRVLVSEPKHLADLYRLRVPEVEFRTVVPGGKGWRTAPVPVRYLESLEPVDEGSCPKRAAAV